MKFLLKIWLIFAAAAIISGCRKEDPYTEPSVQNESAETVYVSLSMNITGSGIPDNSRSRRTRAAQGEEHRTLGTSNENRIESICLLIYDAESSKLADIVSLNQEQVRQLSSAPSGAADGGVKIPLYVSRGQKINIYAAVNLTQKMRRNFILGQIGTDVSVASNGTDTKYCSIMDEFVPDCHGRRDELDKAANGCIPMTGQFTDNGNTIITFTDEMNKPENALPIKAELSRIVAKIHLIAKTTKPYLLSNGETVTYAFAEDKTLQQYAGEPAIEETIDFTNWMGWIRLDSVRYMPNGINKSTYIIPQLAENPQPTSYSPYKDLNMDLNGYILSGTGNNLELDSEKAAKDFCFYTSVPLHIWNINPPHETSTIQSGMAQAEKYDAERLNNTLTQRDFENRYIDGMYCLENYFDVPQEGSAFTGYEDAIPMVTHVSVAAKLTPRNIVVVNNFKAKMEQFIKDRDDFTIDFEKKYNLKREALTDKEIDEWKGTESKLGINRYFPDPETGAAPGTGTEYEIVNYPSTSFLLIKTDTEADATYLLNWSLKANGLWTDDKNDFEQDRYPAGTFYVFDMKDMPSTSADAGTAGIRQHLFLTAGAVASATGDDFYLKAYSVPHLGGWGYYFSYIDPYATGETRAGFATSSVERNTYYILTVNNFGTPGGLGNNPDYIKVNTEAVGWDYAGRGDITLH